MKSYEEALEVDFNNLNENWKDQSRNFMHWAEKWANALAERDKLKEQLKVLTAEKELDIRMDFAHNPPLKMKVTEGLVSSTLAANEELSTLKNSIIEKNEEVDIYASAKTAFEARKKALEGLTHLWVSGYFSTPNGPKEFKEVIRKQSDKERMAAHNQEIKSGNKRLKRRKK
mgnify:FL=1